MGNYERIEITNFANVAFEGVITLSGLSTNNQSINVEIPAYSSRILGKTAKGILDELLLMNSLTVSKLGDKNTS
ncbi:MAG: hypothetical protein LBU27_01580 [Candidatus Peribacteria bacterium]|jgi:hypothetical protein|nr:hypothetical protein [Candidatus Peribacteria bacterium]